MLSQQRQNSRNNPERDSESSGTQAIVFGTARRLRIILVVDLNSLRHDSFVINSALLLSSYHDQLERVTMQVRLNSHK